MKQNKRISEYLSQMFDCELTEKQSAVLFGKDKEPETPDSLGDFTNTYKCINYASCGSNGIKCTNHGFKCSTSLNAYDCSNKKKSQGEQTPLA